MPFAILGTDHVTVMDVDVVGEASTLPLDQTGTTSKVQKERDLYIDREKS